LRKIENIILYFRLWVSGPEQICRRTACRLRITAYTINSS